MNSRVAAASIALLCAASLVAMPGAARATAAQDLDRLCQVYWQKTLERSPVTATSLGDHRWDDRLPDNSRAGIAAGRRDLAWTLDRAKHIDVKALDPAGRVTRSALIETVSGQIGVIDCHLENWQVDPRDGPQVDLMTLPDVTTITSFHEAQMYVARLHAIGRYLDAHIANLRDGLAHGRTAPLESVKRTRSELAELDHLTPDQWPLAEPSRNSHPRWTDSQNVWFQSNAVGAIRDVVRPAMARYDAFLRDKIEPRARPEDRCGLSALPGGAESYQRLIRVHTSLDRTPQELHQLGLREVARIRQELSVLGRKVLGTSDVAAIQKKLRGDPAMHFASADEIEQKAKSTLERARRAIPKTFGRLPKAHCQVKVMGAIESPNSTVAYYRQPAADGSRPGYYMINTWQPATRPRYEAEALAFHESIPGHHLQIAIAQELTGIPEFRRHEGVTAFVEGWGLYSERLANEMGLYSGDVDRIGMLSYDAWRACRLVVDTGIHSMGWSRPRAIDYMTDNTVLAENNVANEIDRYINDPGQALAYKVGQLEILRLREDAKKRLGARFDLKQFHDVVLGNGAVALPVLREQVEAWIARRSGGAPARTTKP